MFDNDKLLFSANNEIDHVKGIVKVYDSYVAQNEVGKRKTAISADCKNNEGEDRGTLY